MARTADEGGDGREWLRQTMGHDANTPSDANQMAHVESVMPTVYIFHDLDTMDRCSLTWLMGFGK